MRSPAGTPDPTADGATHAGTGHAVAIAPHIRLCAIDDQVIVLDLLNNRYAGIAAAPFSRVASAFGWPSVGQAPDPQSADAGKLFESLRARGWLVEASAASSIRRAEPDLPEATQTLLPQRPVHSPRVASVRALRCLQSAVSAAWRLRHRPLFAIAKGVGERKPGQHRNGSELSMDELIDAVSAYLRVRPLLFSARDRCLHDSLTLVTFLAAEGIRARWVIGVRIRPFAAHSWVQHEGLVLNDQHERVRAYRPIFVA